MVFLRDEVVALLIVAYPFLHIFILANVFNILYGNKDAR